MIDRKDKLKEIRKLQQSVLDIRVQLNRMNQMGMISEKDMQVLTKKVESMDCSVGCMEEVIRKEGKQVEV